MATEFDREGTADGLLTPSWEEVERRKLHQRIAALELADMMNQTNPSSPYARIAELETEIERSKQYHRMIELEKGNFRLRQELAEQKRLTELVYRAADPLKEQLAECQAREKVLREALDVVAALIAETSGVVGLHLNGDFSPWSDLLEGGRFEEWLVGFSEALALPTDDTALKAVKREALRETSAWFADNDRRDFSELVRRSMTEELK